MTHTARSYLVDVGDRQLDKIVLGAGFFDDPNKMSYTHCLFALQAHEVLTGQCYDTDCPCTVKKLSESFEPETNVY